jgi:hypothetical protein
VQARIQILFCPVKINDTDAPLSADGVHTVEVPEPAAVMVLDVPGVAGIAQLGTVAALSLALR